MSREILDAVAEWCREDPELRFDPEGPAVEMAGAPPLRLDLTIGDNDVRLTHRVAVRAVGETALAEARKLVNRRGSLLRGTVEAGDGLLQVDLSYRIYRDGLTHQTFLLATQEMAGASDALSALGTPVAAAESPAPQPRPQPIALRTEPQAEKPAVPVPTPVPVADTIEMPTARPTRVPTFEPTHEVPPRGMPAWTHPDPNLPPLPRLEGRVPLRVDEVRGAWARVSAANGWTGWVDYRHLVPLTETPTRASTPAVTAAPGPGALAPAWQPTDYIPAGGLTAWAVPDGTTTPVGHLHDGTPVRVLETQGAWARVAAENGWAAWVDGRRLSPHAVAPTAGQPAASEPAAGAGRAGFGRRFNPLLALAAPVLIVAALMPRWVTFDFDFSLPFWNSLDHLNQLVLGVGCLIAAFVGGRAAAAVGLLGGALLLAQVGAFPLRQLWLDDFLSATRAGWLVVAGALLMLAGGILSAARKDSTT